MESNTWCPRLTAWIILSGSAVHVKGFVSALWSTTKRLIAACRSTTDRKTPRFNRRLESLAKKRSTALSHAAEGGVKWKVQRGTPERIKRQAGETGPKTAALIEIILRERTHPEQGFRASVGILRHAKTFGRARLEAACERALEIGARSYTSVTSILKTNLDRKRPAPTTDGPAITHANIRGPRYFH